MREVIIQFVVSWAGILIPLSGVVLALVTPQKISGFMLMIFMCAMFIVVSLGLLEGLFSVFWGAIAYVMAFGVKYLYQMYKKTKPPQNILPS